MKISKTHQSLSEILKNQKVLENPEEFLGPNWKAVLNFWIYVDTLTGEQWRVIGKRIKLIDAEKRNYANRVRVVEEAAMKTTSYWWDVCWAAYGYSADATLEIIGSHELLNQQKPFTFLSLFLDL